MLILEMDENFSSLAPGCPELPAAVTGAVVQAD